MTRAETPPFAEAVRAELRRGEIIRWSGSPEGPPPLGFVAFILIFGGVWTCFSLVWESAALGLFWDAWFAENRSGTPRGVAALMTAFGLPFVAVGLGMLASPWFIARKRRKTIYVVTDQRFLLIRLGDRKEVSSVEARQIFEIVRKEVSRGLNDIEISRSTKTDS